MNTEVKWILKRIHHREKSYHVVEEFFGWESLIEWKLLWEDLRGLLEWELPLSRNAHIRASVGDFVCFVLFGFMAYQPL